MFEITVDVEVGHALWRPIGDLDALTAPQLRVAFDENGGQTRLLIDLSGVPFVDSSGLGALIGTVRRAREAGGDVVVYGAVPAVGRVLRTAGFDRLATVSSSRAAATQALMQAVTD